jgi:hypothetical protein
MAYSFLLTTWKDSVRRLCGGVSSADVPDTLLDDDLYGPDSEDQIKALITDWDTINKPTELKRAAIYHVASKVCSYLLKKLFQSETIFDYRYELQKIDWAQERNENLAYFYYWLEKAKPGTVTTLTMIDVIPRSEPIYDDLEVVDTEVIL